jgi:phospho-N-acetylmuramoyl-pentapeptide-transferase
VDAKYSSDSSFGLSGTRLFWLLTAGITAAAVALDGMSARVPYQIGSLTLPLVVALAVSAAVGTWVIPILRRLKTGQIIREEGPQSHFSKAGTPTMGGIFFAPTAMAIALMAAMTLPQGTAQWGELLAVTALTLSYGFIGWLDDWQVLRRKSNKGISPRMKLALQIGFGGLFCGWMLLHSPGSITEIRLPLGWVLPLGFLFWPLAWFTLVAESNATNLTDGLDGLAGGVSAIALLGLGAVVAPAHPSLGIFCAALSGGCVGFVAHNRNPARVFMGDTGSLALGGAIAAVALLTNSLWSMVILSGIFVLETVSVILQVGYYKATKNSEGIGKRLFKMAPIHHHLELSGWSELHVVSTFYAVTAALAVVCLTCL